MTPPVGLPSDMDPFALDAGTSERLVTGVVGAGDAPPEYRAVARTLHALRTAPETSAWAGEQAAVERIAAAVVVHRRPTRRDRRIRRSWSRAARLVAAASVVGAVCVAGAFASAGALPQPAQHAASAVLGTVGISVPSGGEQPPGQPPQTVATTTPPAATAPSQPTGRAPGAGAPPAAPSSPTAPGERRNEFQGDEGNGASKDKAKDHGNGRWSGEHDGGPSPHDRGNDNER